jgi:hypothetical protein
MQNKETKENYLALAADYHGKVRRQDADSRTAYSDPERNIFVQPGTRTELLDADQLLNLLSEVWDRTLNPGSIVIEDTAGPQLQFIRWVSWSWDRRGRSYRWDRCR